MTDSDTTRSPIPPAGSTEPPPAPEQPPAAPQPPPAAPEPPPTASQPPRAFPQPPPASAWRPPPSDSGRNVSLFFGAILVVIGAWFFATRTLGLDLPDLDWGQLWPVILIVIGAWIVYGALRQRSR